MNQKIFYLAGAIDLVSDDEAKTWRENATSEIIAQGHGVFNPTTAFKIAAGGRHRSDTSIAQIVLGINKSALDLCDGVLANLAGISIGTPIEIQDAIYHGTPVCCFGPTDPRSFYMATWPTYPSLTVAVDALIAKAAPSQ